MKASVLLLFLLIFNSLTCVKSDDSLVLSSAIKEILGEKFVGKNSRHIDLIYCGQNSGESELLVEEVLRIKTDSLTVQLWKIEAENSSTFHLKFPSLLIFESVEFYSKAVAHIKWQNTRKVRHHHLVYVSGASANDIQNNTSNGFDIDNVAFLILDDKKSIKLASSFMFTPQKCRSNQLKTINEFSRKSMKWNNAEFYPEKYQNFYNCSVSFVSHLGEKQNPFQLEHEVTKALSKSYNFSINYNNTDYDLIETLLMFSDIRSLDELEISAPLLCNDMAFFIPPGEPRAQIEKMFLMFDWEVWVAIALTFAISLVTIQVINRMSIRAQNLVFGSNIRAPTLNLFEIFLCGGQYRVPIGSFARFLLMLFLVWSIIIRTCYQSMLYQYLQADMRAREVKTIAELAEKLTIVRSIAKNDPDGTSMFSYYNDELKQ